eukprot:TRINITY_DN1666_c0_g2_i1.p1 TRINITY_DN1666_c0_g2~~TRINITY_DN1666_c0_g2_i1.p1  ORF type:complete len:387 (+),score=74.81 TRINITY_DN1666_c0_g2_i1:193-1353(+)
MVVTRSRKRAREEKVVKAKEVETKMEIKTEEAKVKMEVKKEEVKEEFKEAPLKKKPTKLTDKQFKRLTTAKHEVKRSQDDCGTKFIGAHCSIAKGVWNAIHEAVSIGGTGVAFFVSSSRSYKVKELTEDDAAVFQQVCKIYRFDNSKMIPHSGYLINMGSPNPETLEKSRVSFIEEMKSCQTLGIPMLNIHPGSTIGKVSKEIGVSTIAETINQAHAETEGVTVLLETMSRQGHTLGGWFEELRDIIELVDDKTRIGVCIDTCHIFAAGYDIRLPEGVKDTLDDFDRIVGLNYLKALHLNDSKVSLSSHKDRHECIGFGEIGIECFRAIMNEPRLDNLPMALETPGPVPWEKEIDMLYGLIGTKPGAKCEDLIRNRNKYYPGKSFS